MVKPTTSKKMIIFRLFLFSFSLTISLVAAEFALRFLGYSIQTARDASFDNSKYDRDEKLKLRKKIAYDKWVVALGDSSTNGSNVDIQKSYPFQLYFHKENKVSDERVRFNILNHGICESNTYQSLNHLKEIINNWNKKPDILIFLGGAADRFSPISNEEQVQVEDLIQDIDQSTSHFLKTLRLYKVYRGIKMALHEKFFLHENEDIFSKELVEISPIFSEILKFYSLGEFEKADEIISKNKSMIHDPHLESILNSTVDELFFKQDREGVIFFTMRFLKKHPQLFTSYARYPLYRMIMAYDFQSEYSADNIINSFNSMKKENAWIAETELFKKYMNLFKNRDKVLEKINKNRITNLRALAELCKRNGIKLVFQNYPANFTNANLALEQVAKEYGLPFVDNNSTFNQMFKEGKKKSNYLAEDEHPSALGYKVIADNVWQTLKTL